MKIEDAAEKEVKRIRKIIPKVEIKESIDADAISGATNATSLLDFAKNYAKDSEFFLEHEKHVEAFEAAIIAWAYIDIGLKLGLLAVPASLRGDFTVDK